MKVNKKVFVLFSSLAIIFLAAISLLNFNSHSALAAACTARTWSPDNSMYCSGVSFTQTSNCGTSRSALGTKTCVTACSATTWTPDVTTYCKGTTFTQTSNCKTTRSSTGTMTCSSGMECKDNKCVTKVDTTTCSYQRTINLGFNIYDCSIGSVSAAVSPSGSGSTSYSITNGILGSGGGTNPRCGNGGKVDITATANAGYKFSSWSGCGGGTSPTCTVTNYGCKSHLNSMNVSVSANFVKEIKKYTLTTSAGAGGTVSAGGTYDEGTKVSVTATPNSGYVFSGWSGDASGSSATVSVTMSSNKSVTASFVKEVKKYTLTATAGTGGTVSGGGTYDEGTKVSVTATHNSGYAFSGWSGDASGSSVTVSVTMNSNKSVTASFIKTYTLTTVVGLSGAGTVSGGGTYTSGTKATVAATVNSGYRFDSWYGSASGSSLSTTVTMDKDKSVTAGYVQTYALTTSASAGGTVSAGGTYDKDTKASVTATPNSGYRFGNWSGSASGSTNPVSVTMSANKAVAANFSKIPTGVVYALTTNVSPASSGEIALSPGGGTYETGSVVSLTAVPSSSSYVFSGWSGDVSGTSNPISITMNSNKSVTATFIRAYTLTIISNPVGAGTITLLSGGSAAGSYVEGTSLNLVAGANAGYRFSSWSGATKDSTYPDRATVIMSDDKTVTANFVAAYTLSVTISPSSSAGSVSLSPSGGVYDSGTTVTLTAAKKKGYAFDYWDGAVTGTTNPATITMDSNKSVTAYFKESAEKDLPKCTFGVQEQYIPYYGTGTFEWTCTDADDDSCSIKNTDSGTVVVDNQDGTGTYSIRFGTSPNFSLTCSNSTGSAVFPLQVPLFDPLRKEVRP